MPVDGLFLHRLMQDLRQLEGCRISKIHALSAAEIALGLHRAPWRFLILNLDSNTNRIYLTNHASQFQDPTGFIMVLRKNLSQAIIEKVEQRDLDRVIVLTCRRTTDLGLQKTVRLVIELMGKYANAILVGEDGRIIDALKHVGSLDSSRRMIVPGMDYDFPSKPERISPLDYEGSVDPEAKIGSLFEGFSPVLAREASWRIQNGQTLESILDEIASSRNLYRYGNIFHLIELQHLQREAETVPLMEGLEHLYEREENQKRLRQKFKRVFRTVQSEIKKLERKIPRLQEAYDQNLDYARFREYGDLLFVFMNDVEKEPQLTLPSLEDESVDVTIPIDMRFDLKTNANLYYKKYHKARRSLDILREQIRIAREELDYFRQLEIQLQYGSSQDLEEIESELVSQRFLFERKGKARKKKRPGYLHLQVDGADIFVGKNNLQNDELLRRVSRKSDLWFHVKDYHGSYVLLRTDNPTEKLIRLASMLAAEFSQSRNSSSVPVDYTPVSQLRRVPGARIGFITMKNNRTIYIDPDHHQMQETIRTHSV